MINEDYCEVIKVTIDIPKNLIDNDFGYVDLRLHKDKDCVNSITTDCVEKPYFQFLKFEVEKENS